jgi:PAS domain S-box-containing protein
VIWPSLAGAIALVPSLVLAVEVPEVAIAGVCTMIVALFAWTIRFGVSMDRRHKALADATARDMDGLRKQLAACERHREEDRSERDQEREAYRRLAERYGSVARALRRLQEQALRTAAVLIADAKGTIIKASAQALAMLRYSSEELIGQSVAKLVPPSLLPAHHRAFRHAAETPEWQAVGTLHGPAIRADGTAVWVEIDLSRSFRRDGEWTFVAELRELHRPPLVPSPPPNGQ